MCQILFWNWFKFELTPSWKLQLDLPIIMLNGHRPLRNTQHSTIQTGLYLDTQKNVVRNVTDCDFCTKNFNDHMDFSYGVFFVGCACKLNVTYGYELMLCRGSAHNIFRLLMCRDLDLYSLKGVIFDHACGLDQYLLNREPREFEFLKCLGDGAHWQVWIYCFFVYLYNKLLMIIHQGQKNLKRFVLYEQHTINKSDYSHHVSSSLIS